MELQVRDLWKRYPTVVANKGINLTLRTGEVVALLGENGAGKSTLVSIIAGFNKPTRGKMYLDGKPYKPKSPKDAMRMGVVLVPQNPKLIESFTVLENLGILLNEVKGKVDLKWIEKKAKELFDKYGLSVELRKKVRELSMGERQRVELLKALLLDAKFILLDEPSTHLSPEESKSLVSLCRTLAAEGKGVVYITHYIQEALSVADRIIVMRNGEVVKEVKEATQDQLLELMFGKKIEVKVKKDSKVGETVLKVEKLSIEEKGVKKVKDVSFEIREGEIVGIAGIAGHGQRELFEALIGIRKVNGGKIILRGRDVTNMPPKKRIELGLANVPEERLGWGLVPGESITFNSILGMYYTKKYLTSKGLIKWRWAKRIAEKIVLEMKVKTKNVKTNVEMLSGGNMQKVMIGRELEKNPKVLIAFNPTSGLDYASTGEVRRKLTELAKEGTGILVISEDLEELLEICDKIYVMNKGEMRGPFAKPFESKLIAKAMVIS